MSKKKDQDIALACYAMVSGQFARFVNSKNQYETFTWDSFPKLMVDHCRDNIFMHVTSSSIKEEHLIRATAANFGKEIATTLLERMTQ